jgi:bifunctional non-homologous end joining protein LigD
MKSQISAKSDRIEALKALIPREFSCRAPRYMGPVLRFIPPCLPTLRDRLPHGEGWLYEVKFDGYRMQAHKTGDRVTLFTRNGADGASRLPHLAGSLSTLPCSSAIITVLQPDCGATGAAACWPLPAKYTLPNALNPS